MGMRRIIINCQNVAFIDFDRVWRSCLHARAGWRAERACYRWSTRTPNVIRFYPNRPADRCAACSPRAKDGIARSFCGGAAQMEQDDIRHRGNRVPGRVSPSCIRAASHLAHDSGRSL